VIDGDPVALGGAKPRSVLALLLLAGGETVATDRLVDELWGDRPPPTAVTALQGYISALRKALGSEVVVTRAPGYAAAVSGEQVDLRRFEAALRSGRNALARGEYTTAAHVLRGGLAQWRGAPLADLARESFAANAIRELDELHLEAWEACFEAELALGRQRGLIGEIAALARKHPLRERLWRQLMLALYRDGRQAEALDAYREARRTMVDQIGLEPGPALRTLEQAILERDPALGSSEPLPPLSPSPAVVATPVGEPRRRRRRHRSRVALAALAAIAAVVLVATHEHPSTGLAAAPADSVAVLDPATGRIEAVVGVGHTPTAVTVGADAVWVLNADDRTITRIDARTRRVSTFATDATPTDLAAAPDGLWVGNGRSLPDAQFVGPVTTSVSQLDNTTHAVRETVALRTTGGKLSNASRQHIVVAQSGIWVVDPDFSVTHLDPQTGRVRARLTALDVVAIAASGDQVWALGGGHLLTRIDPRTDSVATNVTVPAGDLSAIAVGGGAVWATDPAEGTLWRVDPGPPLRERTIDVGAGADAVTFGDGLAWVANRLAGTVLAVDPATNRVVRRVNVGNTPRGIAVGDGRVWVSVAAGPTGRGAPGAAPPESLPGATCGRMFAGVAHPDRVIVSDLPLQGGPRSAVVPMSEAIAYVLREHGFRAGRFTIGYRSCDDSTAEEGIFDVARCEANARAYAAARDVIAVIGPYNSGCTEAELPVFTAAPGGPLAALSPTNTDPALTLNAPREQTGYARLVAHNAAQANATMILLRKLHRRRPLLLYDGSGAEAAIASEHVAAARAHHVHLIGLRAWSKQPDRDAATAAQAAQAHPDAVIVCGLIDTGAGRIIRALRRRLGSGVAIVGTDGLLPVSGLFAAAGPAARGTYIPVAGLVPEGLSPEGRSFVKRFAATQPDGLVTAAAVYAAQAGEIMLGAIARSDGTRAGVARSLRATHLADSLVGPISFDAHGDVVPRPVTILRAEHGGGPMVIAGTDGATIDRVIEP
jgi:YVTN family beta-propeller protein